ncbi:MAG: OmpA family protein [Pseudomonadota bacterium]
MKKSNKAREKQAHSWQLSFNDLMTIMLVFFILLVSISNIRADKVQHVSSSASLVFGSRKGQDRRAEMIRILSSVEGVKAYMVDGGVSVVLGESLLYRSGSADIIHKEVLMRLGEALKAGGGEIRVEGHTDALPIARGLFPSNWELSTQRAVNVVKFLVGECGMNPAIFSAAGYADSKPVATDKNPEGRSLNRRVNIILSLK